MAEYGFDRIIYGFSHFMSKTSLGDPDDFVLLTNHDPKYMNLFIGSGLYRDAPMVRWALNNVGACSWGYLWDELASGSLSEREKQVIKLINNIALQQAILSASRRLHPAQKVRLH